MDLTVLPFTQSVLSYQLGYHNVILHTDIYMSHIIIFARKTNLNISATSSQFYYKQELSLLFLSEREREREREREGEGPHVQ